MNKRKVSVLVGGCFDIIHIGHIKFLKSARSLGDVLIVALEPDRKVKALKGKNRPVNNQGSRMEALLALKAVDQVIKLPYLATDNEYADFVRRVNPNIIATTAGDPILEKKMVHANSIGSKLIVLPKYKTKSTSDIIQLLSK